MAGFIAFSGLLSLFPFLIFAATLTGILVGAERSDTIIESLFEIAPEHVAQTLAPVVVEVLNKQSGEVLTLSALFAIWVASSAVEAFRIAFDRAYAVPDPRGFIENRALAIALVFLGAIVAALLGVTILFSPLILRFARARAAGAGAGDRQLHHLASSACSSSSASCWSCTGCCRGGRSRPRGSGRGSRHHGALGGRRLGLLDLPELHARPTR